MQKWPCLEMHSRPHDQKDPDEFLSFILPHFSALGLFDEIKTQWKTEFTSCGHVSFICF